MDKSLSTLSARHYREWFAGVFAQWLRANFQTPAHVAVAFGVTERCAINWLDGINCPNGPAVAFALTSHPRGDDLRRALEGVEA